MNLEHKRYDEILELISKIIAHPHTALTAHDKHRALIIVSFIGGDEEMYEYFLSKCIKEDFDAMKAIRNSVVHSK